MSSSFTLSQVIPSHLLKVTACNVALSLLVFTAVIRSDCARAHNDSFYYVDITSTRAYHHL